MEPGKIISLKITQEKIREEAETFNMECTENK